MEKRWMVRDAMSVIQSRRSVRDFTGAAVDEELIDDILRAGMSAPTAVNMQPWSFVVVTDRETLDRLCDGLPYGKMLGTAGAAIVVCALPEMAYENSSEFAVIDSTCATENILLAAEALGLGAVWVAVWPDQQQMAHIRSVLQIPDRVIPLNVIPLGHPTESRAPIDKYHPEKIHRGKW